MIVLLWIGSPLAWLLMLWRELAIRLPERWPTSIRSRLRGRPVVWRSSWRCTDCGAVNLPHEWCCYVCGAGHPDDA